jgi:hypothetical protein
MRKIIKTLMAAVILCLLTASSASAISLTATGTGPITAYFYGSSAGYGSVIGLWVNGVAQGIYGLQDNSTAPGTSLVLGSANAGDTLVFELQVSTSNSLGPPPYSYSLYTDPTLNYLGEEHAVSSAFAGGPYGIPAGILVGFEDIQPLASSDRDFNDHMFVFTGVTNSTPDGGMTFMLLGIGLSGLAALRRKG